MRSRHSGTGQVSPHILQFADDHWVFLPNEAHLITGLNCRLSETVWLLVDLVVVTEQRMLFGFSAERSPLTNEQPLITQTKVALQSRAAQPLTVDIFWIGDPLANPQNYPVVHDEQEWLQLIVSTAPPILNSVQLTRWVNWCLREDFRLENQPRTMVQQQLSEPLQTAVQAVTPPPNQTIPRPRVRPAKTDVRLEVDHPPAPSPTWNRATLLATWRRGREWLQNRRRAVEPTDVTKKLKRAMSQPQNYLADAQGNKIVLSHFTIELAESVYREKFELIWATLATQWRGQLQTHLETLNGRSRLTMGRNRTGQQEYTFHALPTFAAAPRADVLHTHCVIRCSAPERSAAPLPQTPRAYLIDQKTQQRFALQDGQTILGRDRHVCDVYPTEPIVQQKRLVGNEHAYIVCRDGICTLFDGSPNTKRPSTNGTFVNYQPVKSRTPLRDGDTIILAASDQTNPRLETPGVAVFVFQILL